MLGLQCKEIHVCGGAEAQDVVANIAEACSDDFEVETYQRFSDLTVANESLSEKPDKAGCYRHVSELSAASK